MRISTRPALPFHDYDWWLERVQVAEQVSATEVRAACPVCGSSDNLHVEAKPGGHAVVHCFTPSCVADRGFYAALLEAVQEGPPADPEPTESDPNVTDSVTPAPVMRRVKRRSDAAPSPAPTQVADPMAWYLQYMGLDPGHEGAVRLLGVGVSADGWLTHGWDHTTVTKDRQPAGDLRRWTPKGAIQPRIWPSVGPKLPEEIWLVEGETDCIVMRVGYGVEAYTAGSASQPPTTDEFKALRDRGVERVVVAYDSDKAGRVARESVLEAAREVGLIATLADMGDPLLGPYKDWRERWLSGDRTDPTDRADAEIVFEALSDHELQEQDALLLGRLHPYDHTILFGDGGTGKGVIASWWAERLVREEDMDVLVVDYEKHADEWKRRVGVFGCGRDPEADPHPTAECTDPNGVQERILIAQPDVPIWEAAGALSRLVKDRGIDYVIVDSIAYAVVGSGGKAEDSETAARYSRAVQQLKAPVLSLAHTTKADADPKHPFGSVFWSNGARVTIGVVAVGTQSDPRKLEVKKANQGGQFDPVQIPWDWVGTGLPHGGLGEQAVGADDVALAYFPEDGSEIDGKGLAKWLSEHTSHTVEYWTDANRDAKLRQEMAREGKIEPGSKRGMWRRTQDHVTQEHLEGGRTRIRMGT